jgi:hypothetical protein
VWEGRATPLSRFISSDFEPQDENYNTKRPHQSLDYKTPWNFSRKETNQSLRQPETERESPTNREILSHIKCAKNRLKTVLTNPPTILATAMGNFMNDQFVFISAISPYPIDSGKKVFINGLLQYMIDKLGRDKIHYFIIGRHNKAIIEVFKKHYGINVHYLGGVTTLEILQNIFFSFFSDSPKCFQECLLYSKKVHSNLFEALRDIDPFLTIADTIRMGQYFERNKPTDGNYTLYLEDLFSIRYQRMLDSSLGDRRGTLNATGNFISNIPIIFRGLITFPILEKILLLIELKRAKGREINLPGKFKLNLLLNADDVAELRRNNSSLNVEKVPPLFKMSKRQSRIWNGDPEFVFLGDLNVAENSISLEIFIKKCVEKLITRIPKFKLIIIGKGIPETLQILVDRNSDSIKYMGYVDNIDEVLARCAAMIIPMLFGSGIRFKALDAFLRGLPVVATPLGVEGLELENTGTCLIANSIELMPDLMELVLDKSTNLKLSESGCAFFSENFEYNKVRHLYDSLFDL